jgi:uncharacterized protein
MTQPNYAYLDSLGASQVFFPRRDPVGPPPGANDIAIEVEPGISIGARYYHHQPDAPSILYFHGNGEVASDHDDIAPLYHAIGCNLFVAEFRGYGRSDGSPSFEHLVTDARAVCAAFHALLDEWSFGQQRFVMGRSLGSHCALEIGANATERLQGIIIESGSSGIERLLQRLGASDSMAGQELRTQHDDKLRSIDLPVLIIHGEQDDLVPIAQAETLQGLLQHTTVTFERIHGAGHNDLLWRGQTQYFAAIAKHLNSGQA